MPSKVYQMRFSALSQARIGASFISGRLKGSIGECNVAGLNILLYRDGTVHVFVRFDSPGDLQRFDELNRGLIEELQASLQCRGQHTTAINLFTFEREAVGV